MGPSKKCKKFSFVNRKFRNASIMHESVLCWFIWTKRCHWSNFKAENDSIKNKQTQNYFQKMCSLRPIHFQAPSWNTIFLLALFMLKPSPCFSQISQKEHICIYKARLICKGASSSAKLQRKDKRTEKSCFQLQAKRKSLLDSHAKNKGVIFPLSNYMPLSGRPVISFRW